VLLDIHPEPEHGRVRVQTGGQIHDIGVLDDTAYIRDIHAGRAVVKSLIRESLFQQERKVVFDHILHVSDVDTWLARRAQLSSRSILDPRIVERARELLADREGEILVAERGYATRLRRR
jgi:hypothetical protein